MAAPGWCRGRGGEEMPMRRVDAAGGPASRPWPCRCAGIFFGRDDRMVTSKFGRLASCSTVGSSSLVLNKDASNVLPLLGCLKFASSACSACRPRARLAHPYDHTPSSRSYITSSTMTTKKNHRTEKNAKEDRRQTENEKPAHLFLVAAPLAPEYLKGCTVFY